jgi:hypothetical protein
MGISRRRVLRASMLAAPTLLLARKEIIRPAQAWTHGNNVPLAVPAPAASYGLQTLSFYDPCTSLATVDVNNTKAPGRKRSGATDGSHDGLRHAYCAGLHRGLPWELPAVRSRLPSVS